MISTTSTSVSNRLTESAQLYNLYVVMTNKVVNPLEELKPQPHLYTTVKVDVLDYTVMVF